MHKSLFFVAALCWPLSVAAHTAHSGWTYDPECCASYDCQQVADANIIVTPQGYQVRLAPGQHIMLPMDRPPVLEVIPFGDTRVRVSGDSHKHVCLNSSGRIYCIYIPPGGV